MEVHLIYQDKEVFSRKEENNFKKDLLGGSEKVSFIRNTKHRKRDKVSELSVDLVDKTDCFKHKNKLIIVRFYQHQRSIRKAIKRLIELMIHLFISR